MAHARPISGFALMILLLALAAAGKAVLYDTLDPDSFWHLRVAEQLQRDGVGPLVDGLSFASTRTPWTPYSWLAELGMKAIWDVGGYRAAIAAQALMVAGLFIFIALASNELVKHANPIAVVVAVVGAMYLALPYLSFRPVTFALMLLAMCAWLLLRDRQRNQTTRAVWLVVPTTVLITNCHFYSIFVPLWIGALVAGALWERRNVARYAAMLGATVLACAATPMLPGFVGVLWRYQFADPMLSAGLVNECRPFYSGALGPLSLLLVAAWLALVCLRRERFGVGQWLWMLGALALLFRLGRFAPLFVIVAAPTLAAALPKLGGSVLERKAVRFAMASVLAIGMLRLAMAFPRPDTPLSQWVNRHGAGTPGYPCEAADFVEANIRPATGRLINEFSWGGYLAWRLGERFQVLLDGRTQLYRPHFWQATYLQTPTDATDVLLAARADAAVLPVHRSRFSASLRSHGWHRVYSDDRAEVLVPPLPQAARVE